MTAERIDLRHVAPQPWKNGAGLTREIAFGGASGTDFDWRISLAEVARDAPFSAFPGIDRCILLLIGAGMRLKSVDGAIDHALTTALAPFHFPGDAALDATLIDGPSTDFNVMTRRGTFRSEVSCEREATELDASDVTMLLCAAGEWAIECRETIAVKPMHALLWREPKERVRIRPLVGNAALVVARLCHDRRP